LTHESGEFPRVAEPHGAACDGQDKADARKFIVHFAPFLKFSRNISKFQLKGGILVSLNLFAAQDGIAVIQNF